MKKNDLISRAAAIEAIKPLLYSGNCVSTLINMPTVDAIPVEWLRKWPKSLREGAYVRDILKDWQKEHEAQGT